jgi:hypothetical protein
MLRAPNDATTGRSRLTRSRGELILRGMNSFTESRWLPVVLLTCSNVFMTFAWYGHLKFKGKPLALVILASWGIALFECILMVPANRWAAIRSRRISSR